ncbi:hypothetical protein AYK21_00795 [Thermoplasmatales archaeon SG8-52-2]|nr:MAG: hypothetical protein AYK21_00795 [Thermoplasmatales archaeon SG8-52-2]
MGIIALLTGLVLTKSINAVVLTSKPQIKRQNYDLSALEIKYKKEVFDEIKETKDKILVCDKIIGDRYVKYWEHVIDNIFVKNDSMLLHMNQENVKIMEFNKSWSNIQVSSINYKSGCFKGDYIWKRKIVFPDEDDCDLFYTFYSEQNYPLFCWEVRYENGSTYYFNLNETPIGCSVTAPSAKGFVVQGYGDSKWRYWRENAQEWYAKWFDSINSISSPSIDQISYFIKNKSIQTDAFYVIAHSGNLSSRFLANKDSYYTASHLHYDMENREPMKLAILCCCSALTYAGPGSLSYELRKGTMNDTVTIGYHDMENCPNWIQSLDWQDYMFKRIDKGLTVKKAYDRACAKYPQISDYVRFIGDPNLRINHNNTDVLKISYDAFSKTINLKSNISNEIFHYIHSRINIAT